ncbi:MAG: glucosaminidase domain-containing protein [Methylophagaceae bacterium]|tara:strand:+ start:2002 stop:2661 length:660 start_codon:yes stop_codon:yes gene_type:complete
MSKTLRNIKEGFQKFFTVSGVIAVFALIGWVSYAPPIPAGTDTITVEKVVEEVEPIVDVEKLLITRPDFEHNSNQSFLESVEGCIVYISKTTTDILPVNSELLLAQAALESGWGTSRFAREGKNLFGIRTYDLREPHMLPSNKPKKWGVKVYQHECDSVQHYMNILNDGSAFTSYQEMRDTIGIDDPFKLVFTLDAYATDKNYFDKVKSIIKKIRKDYR